MEQQHQLSERAAHMAASIRERLAGLRAAEFSQHLGIVTEIRESFLTVNFSGLCKGEICTIKPQDGSRPVLAETISVGENSAMLFPLKDTAKIQAGCLVTSSGKGLSIPVGRHLLGTVIDGLGNPLFNHFESAEATEIRPLKGEILSPLSRPLLSTPLATGVKAIDAFATLAKGQRICLMGAAGAGKSTLIASIARNADADVVVIGLVGERGREVKEFLERHLPAESRDRIVVVASTSDCSALERFYATHTASTVAEYFRDQGQSVLLIVDSLTRVARALREIGLALGEPPARRGYPASVYPQLPKLVERSGRSEHGDITAIYTVLSEGENDEDPIVEEIKSLTDGHIALSRKLAQSGRYPAIDPLQSLSRLMHDIVDPRHAASSQKARLLLSKYQDIEILVQVGEYKRGSDALTDEAIKKQPSIVEFLKQDMLQSKPFEETVQTLEAIVQ